MGSNQIVFREDYLCSLFIGVRIVRHLPEICPLIKYISSLYITYALIPSLHNWKCWCINSKKTLCLTGILRVESRTNIQPWGTPAKISFQLEVLPWSTTLWNLFVQKRFIKTTWGSLYNMIRSYIISLHAALYKKTLDMSKNMTSSHGDFWTSLIIKNSYPFCICETTSTKIKAHFLSNSLCTHFTDHHFVTTLKKTIYIVSY